MEFLIIIAIVASLSFIIWLFEIAGRAKKYDHWTTEAVNDREGKA